MSISLNGKATFESDPVREGNPSVLLSHPTGNQNVRNALRGLTENGMLLEFWTAIAWNADSKWSRALPSKLRELAARRAFSEISHELIKCVPWREIVRLGAMSSPLNAVCCSGERPFSVIGMYRNFDGRVARRLNEVDLDSVYAYEGGALQTFRQAKNLGITTLYELPSSYWYWEHELLSEEAERSPEFAELLPKLKDSAAHMKWKDEELLLADTVVVPSMHVKSTLAGVVAEENIRVISYGAPPLRQKKATGFDAGGPLRVLFVGSLSQRKGIGYLLDAIDRLGTRVVLTLVGQRICPNQRVDAACSRWEWFDALPHSRVIELMGDADVLVLPSLAEGCALVVLEALACGLPVIVTPNTGALDFVRDGREGFVVPIRDSEAIANCLNALSLSRELLAEISCNAHTTAAENSWENYRHNFAKAVRAVAWS
jgi:glycosyltransferase involved in cell wall biosynthesis